MKFPLALGAISLFATLLLPRGAAAQTIRYVDDSATGANNGSSWANAFTDLQDGLRAATAGNQLWVAAGTYYPTNDTTAAAHFLLRPSVSLYGGFTGAETQLIQRPGTNRTSVLSGDTGTLGSDIDNCNTIVKTAGANGALIDGFTLTKARNTGAQGGGMHVSALITVRNCVFLDNSGYEGSALHLGAAGSDNTSLIDSCIFDGNISSHRGGAVQNYGANGSTTGPTFMNCLFINNTCAPAGGAMALYHNAVTLLNCTFAHNHSDGGDAIYTSNNNDVYAHNCIFYDTGDNGGGIFVKTETGGNAQPSATVTFSDLMDGFNPPAGQGSGSDNITSDPMFVDSSGNYRLQSGSPCKDTGITLVNVVADLDDGERPAGSGYDRGAYEFGSLGPGTPPTALILQVR